MMQTARDGIAQQQPSHGSAQADQEKDPFERAHNFIVLAIGLLFLFRVEDTQGYAGPEHVVFELLSEARILGAQFVRRQGAANFP